MNPSVKLAVPLALLASAGCVPLRQVLPDAAAPDPASGYLAATMRAPEGPCYVLALVGDAGQEYLMPLGRAGAVSPRDREETMMIALPPGTYRATHWMIVNVLREQLTREPVPERHRLARPFKVEAGQVVLVGKLEGVVDRSTYGTTRWAFRQGVITANEARAALLGRYPAFERASTSCLLCLPGEEATNR